MSQSGQMVAAAAGSGAIITPYKRSGARNKLFYNARCSLKQRLEVDFRSRASAEEVLMDSAPGSVLLFVHTEPTETSKGSSYSTCSSSSQRHSLYCSFRYRRTVIHYENNWVQLREMYREGLGRVVFGCDPKQFEKTQELYDSFQHSLRGWLEAIVKAANFMDEDAMAMDLQDLLRVQNHVILTRRSLQQVGVMLFKQERDDSGSSRRKLTSVGIVFNFEELKVHDDDKKPLENFHDVFQQFIGLHPGLPLPPLEREDEDDSVSMHLLEGLSEETPAELRRQRLMRLLAALRNSGDPSPEVLELATTLLLPQLLHSKALSFSPGYDSARSTSEVVEVSHIAFLPNVALGEVEVLLCDILADLCDLHGTHVVPHLWRLFRAYLGDPSHWYSCLLAMALLTRISSQLNSQLLHTDCALFLFDVLVDVQKQLTRQREEVLAATGRMNRLHLPQIPQTVTVSSTPASSRTFGMDWTSLTAPWSPLTASSSKAPEVPEPFEDHRDHPLSVPSETPMSSASEPERNTSVPRSLSFGVMDLAAPLRWPMQAMQGSLDLPLVPPGPSRPAVPPLNLDAAKLVASDGPNSSSTHRLKTQSSRLSRRLKLEAQRPNPNPACLFSCTSISSHNDVLAETGRFTVTPFVGMKRSLLPAPGPKLMGAPVQAGDELAKMLGESALLADLGPLLRLKQEMEVQEAVEKRSVSSNASASGSDAQQTTASLANRIASQESLISGFTATPRDTQVTARRPAPFRRLRLHACLVLEGLCQAIPSRSPGFFEVPVEDIFEMLQSSCSRAGACSFNLDEQPEPVPSQASKVLELHLSAARVAKLQHFAARLWLCNSSQRCVCGGDSGRIDDACSPCTCVDDATASCLWQLLAEHARQVDTKVAKCVTTPSCPSKEEVQEVCFDHAPSGGHQDGAEDPEDLLGKKWQWHRRLGLDSFLKLVAASLRQAISQLKGAQRAGTAGPDVIMSLQHRLSATLRLASRYLRPPAALPYGVPLTPQRLLLAQQVLSAPLTALKAYLASSMMDLERHGRNSGKPQNAAALRLWVTYLELVGILLLGVRSSGGQLGHKLLVMLLDFPLPLRGTTSSRPANSLQFKGLPTASISPPSEPEQAPTSLPSGFFALCSAPLRASPPKAPVAPLQVSTFWECLSKVFDRVLNHRGDAGVGDTNQINKSLLLAFIEALLDFAHDVSEQKKAGHIGSPRSNPAGAGGLATLCPSVAEAMLQKLFEWLQFLFLPPSGLICRLASTVSVSNPNLLKRVVRCERALFSVPDVCSSTFARKYNVLEHYVRRHFLAFVALYNNRHAETANEAQCNAACQLHVETLLAMASIRMDDHLPRRAFLQQSVLDFFVGEIELEHVTHQMHLNFMRRQNKSAANQSPRLKPLAAEPKLPAPAAVPAPVVAPDKMKPVGKARPVPSLSFTGLPASLQGCSGLGAAPPEEVSRLDPVGLEAQTPLIQAAPEQDPRPSQEPLLPDSSDEEDFPPQPAEPAEPLPVEPAEPAEDPPMMRPMQPMLQLEEAPTPPVVPAVPPLPPLKKEAKVPKVPSLSFMGLRPSLQGCSGLGAPPPEEPGMSQPEAEAPCLPSQWEPEGPDSSDEELEEVSAPCPPAAEPNEQPEVIPHESPEQQEQEPQAASGDLSEDHTEMKASGIGTKPAESSEPELVRQPPQFDRSKTEGEEMDSSDEDLLSEEGHDVGMLRSASAPPGLGFVPKLSLIGVRSSLQGSALMGLPPPEEPGQREEAPETALDQISRGSGQMTPSMSPFQRTEAPVNDLCSTGVIHQNVFYFEGRQRRRIYQDLELHASVLTLILTLLLTPRGRLDPNHCDPYPSHKHRRNIPFLLSKHLNHSANRAVLPWVFQQVDKSGRIGELRLLKLLVESAMHRWMYSNMRMLGAGQFGTVMQSSVTVGSGQLQVAIKHIPKQANIQDRCVLVDVFTEISCLDTIRFEENVCHIYDFGVEESCYWIVMKYYASTLKKWRASLGPMKEQLPVLLAVFKQILQGLAVLHENDIIHYDLKCDNVMIELNQKQSLASTGDEGALSPSDDDCCEGVSQGVPRIALGDFGESRIMENSQELDMRNRGTEILKAPEMLELDFVSRRDSKAHDRRKRVGTSKAADIWSLGCIFFELLTGRFLFEDYDIASHWACATGKSGGDVISEENERRLDNNGPLLEYLRFLLVRDAHRRPTIQMATKKFESTAMEVLGSEGIANAGSWTRASGFNTPESPRSIAPSLGSNSSAGARLRQSFPPDRPLTCAAVNEGESYFAKVLSNLCILEVSDEDLLGGLGALKGRLGQLSWTHIVDFRCHGAAPLPLQDMARVLQLPWTSPERPALEFLDLLPTVFDFLRHAAVLRGVVLFVDGYAKVSERSGEAPKGGSKRHGGLAIGAVLALVAESYHLDIYSALSYVSSQLLVAALRPDVVRALASWQEDLRYGAWARCRNLVRIACFCGACHWYVPQAYLSETVKCSCGEGLCPYEGGCQSYMSWLRSRFGVKVHCITWLWLPTGAQMTDYNHAPFDDSTVARPLQEQVELMEPHTAKNRKCFRCKTCQVMTHAEVVEAAEIRRVLVTHDLDFQAPGLPQGDVDDIPTEASDQSITSCPTSCFRPPSRLSNVPLSEMLLPNPSIYRM